METYLRLGQDVSHLAVLEEQVAMDRADQEDRQDPEDPEDPGAREAMDQGHQVDLQMDQYQ